MITRILIAAILAGIVAGLFATAVQAWRVTPLIIEAERYEADMVESGQQTGHSHGDEAGTGGSPESEAWAPADGMERLFYTGLSNIGVGIAFALILSSVALFLNVAPTLHAGLVLGVGGFIAFVLAPNFGLPPELPGMQAAGLAERQAWWVATVLLTGVALVIFAFRRERFWIVAGVAMMVAPHLYGAPQPLSHDSAVPANLAAEFAVASLVSSALFWLVLGTAFGFIANRLLQGERRA